MRIIAFEMIFNPHELDFSVIRDLRKRSGLTLNEVSENSGISAAGLSRIERNQTSLELNTLYRIARALGLSATDLLGLAESCSAHAKKATSYESGPFHFEKVGYKNVDLFHATAKKGDSLKRPEAHGDEFEVCWVRSGKITITLPRERHTLESGESLQFDAALEHGYEIIEDSEIIIVHLAKEHRF
ncbi:MAG: XRE family transcriptional regulator [Verrucomicrobiota bacterium]